MGNVLLLIILLSSLKLEMKQTFSLFFGIVNVGVAHSELFLHSKYLCLLIYKFLF